MLPDSAAQHDAERASGQNDFALDLPGRILLFACAGPNVDQGRAHIRISTQSRQVNAMCGEAGQ